MQVGKSSHIILLHTIDNDIHYLWKKRHHISCCNFYQWCCNICEVLQKQSNWYWNKKSPVNVNCTSKLKFVLTIASSSHFNVQKILKTSSLWLLHVLYVSYFSVFSKAFWRMLQICIENSSNFIAGNFKIPVGIFVAIFCFENKFFIFVIWFVKQKNHPV